MADDRLVRAVIDQSLQRLLEGVTQLGVLLQEQGADRLALIPGRRGRIDLPTASCGT